MKKLKILFKNLNTKYKGFHKYYIFILVFFIVLFSGIAFSRYVNNSTKSTLYVANGFYFESEELIAGTSKRYVLQNGVDEITIEIKNYPDSLRTSETDIKYKISITDQNRNPVTDKEDNTVNPIEGKLEGNKQSREKVTFSKLKNGTYRVTAVSTEPYSKILEGVFQITNSNNEINYSVSDALGSPIVQLIVETYDYEGDVVITYPSGLSPDNTDSFFKNVNTGTNSGEVTVHFEANSEYIFQFFKTNPNILFTKSQFSVDRK